MNKDEARQTVKTYLADYLRRKGINTRTTFNCLSPEHKDKHPSMSYDKRAHRVKCFACGVSYDIFDLIGIDYGLTNSKDIFNKAYSLYGVVIDEDGGQDPNESKPTGTRTPAPSTATRTTTRTTTRTENKTETNNAPKTDYTDYFLTAKERLDGSPAADYLQERGISEDTAKVFYLGYDPKYKTFNTKENGQTAFTTWKALIIPTGKGSYIARNIDEPPEPKKKNRYRKSGESVLFNSKALYKSSKPVFIVEGEIDALSIIEAGGEAVALGSTSNYRQLVNILKDKPTAQPLILALDNDEEGRKCEHALADELTTIKASFYRFNPYGICKDANEALTMNREFFIDEIRAAEQAQETEQEAAREAAIADYKKTSAAYYIQDFINGIQDSANTPAINTGFDNLDMILDGGLYEGLYIIGAISSLGKTTFALQLIDQLAGRDNDCLVFSLEMSRHELMAKSISRNTFLKADRKSEAKTTRGITARARWETYSEADKANIDRAIQDYKDYAEHIYIHEGVGNIGIKEISEAVKQHIDITGNRPIILIDYVQILAPYDMRASDKQNTDKAITELKRLSRDYKIPVIGISSFNRDNYMAPVNNASFKESGAIEYSADVLIGLQYDGMDYQDSEKEADRLKRIRELFRTNEGKARQGEAQIIQAKILKNRNGSRNEALFKFYAKYNCFMEYVPDFEPVKNSKQTPFNGVSVK